MLTLWVEIKFEFERTYSEKKNEDKIQNASLTLKIEVEKTFSSTRLWPVWEQLLFMAAISSKVPGRLLDLIWSS